MDAMNQAKAADELVVQISSDKDLQVLKDFELAAVGGGIADVIGI